MNNFNFDILINAVDHFVQEYKSDADIDKKFFIDNTPFIHIARHCGTRMITMNEFTEVAKKVISEPHGYTKVIFSQVHNSGLLKICYENNIHTLEYDTQQKTDCLIHYYDGKQLKKVNSIDPLYSVVKQWQKSAQYKINKVQA